MEAEDPLLKEQLSVLDAFLKGVLAGKLRE